MPKPKIKENTVSQPPEISITQPENGSDTVQAAKTVMEVAGAETELAQIHEKKQDDATRDLALALFDQTQELHDLGENSRLVLEQAARLSEKAIPHTKKGPHYAALNLARDGVNSDLSDQDLYSLAAVLAYHQGKLKRKQIGKLDLSPAQVRQTLTVAALLEIAIGLQHSGGGTEIRKIECASDKIWIVVDGPQAEADAAAAESAARLWTRIGYPEVEVLEAGEAANRLPAFPEPTDAIGMDADDLLAEAGRKVLRYQFARMLSQEAGTRLGEDIEFLHRMRVATRRLRAAFDVFEDAFEPGALKPYRRGMRRIGRALGTVRDLDVIMEKGRNYCESLPPERCGGLDPLMQMWAAQREAARGELLTYMNSKEYAAFKHKFNLFLNTPGVGARTIPAGQPTASSVRLLAPVLIYQRLGAVRAYGPFLEGAPVEMLHMLRIEFKKLRYTVEYFDEVLDPKRSGIIIELLKSMQDHLGDLNDAEVVINLLRGFIDELETKQASMPVQERKDAGEIIAYMAFRHAERHRLMTTFQAEWEKNFEHANFRKTLAQAITAL